MGRSRKIEGGGEREGGICSGSIIMDKDICIRTKACE